ncbi:MAG: PEP-CTERM sorting domain-containing protein [Planctomycetaceae bacterium]|nr:PEP-CTERM sorting domain-containing protein [Planctomycetaceae bacterium]
MIRTMQIPAACLAALLIIAENVHAGIIWDYSPATTGATNTDWANLLSFQSFAESITFGSAVQISGMDIYCLNGFATLGDSVTIRLWADASGQPGAVLSSFTESVAVIDSDGAGPSNERVHVDFTSLLNLDAGTPYWIGMTGTTKELTQTGLKNPNAPGDSRMAQFNGGDTFSHFTPTGVGDMAFRLEGSYVASVPEPSSMAMCGIGACVAGFRAVRRRREKKQEAPFITMHRAQVGALHERLPSWQ